MRKYTKSLVALFLAISLLISSYMPIFAVGKYVVEIPVSTSAATQPTYSKTYNSGERGEVCTALSPGAASYYTGSYAVATLMSQSKSTLENTLRTLMRETHSKITNYDNCRDYSYKTDCENEQGKVNQQITMLYTGAQVTYSDYQSGSGWNREHVWPQSLGGGNTSGGGADLHHIRPDENRTNGDRGNLKFGETSGSQSKGNLSGEVGGIKGSGYFEPNDDTKGDVARIVLYVYVRWYTDWGAQSVTEVFQSVDVLLEWCALDPVDTWEMGRNEVVQQIQGNRNVFIDYPELAWKMFGKTPPANMPTPSNGGSSLDPSCPHTNTTVKNQTNATCGQTGYTGDTYCTSCNGMLSSGTATPATGEHSYGNWVENNTNNTRTQTCSTCGHSVTETIACKHIQTNIRNKTVETCGADGYTGDVYCTICQQTLTQGETIPATGKHSYPDSWVLDKQSNTETRSCTVCGEIQTKSAELENCTHESTDIRNVLAVTCGNDGYTGDKCCSRCDVIVEKGRKIFATGRHEYGEIAVVVEPTIVEDGQGKQVCSVCYAEIVVVIPALAIDGEVTAEQLVAAFGSDAEKILLLLAMGMIDRSFIDELSQ